MIIICKIWDWFDLIIFDTIDRSYVVEPVVLNYFVGLVCDVIALALKSVL